MPCRYNGWQPARPTLPAWAGFGSGSSGGIFKKGGRSALTISDSLDCLCLFYSSPSRLLGWRFNWPYYSHLLIAWQDYHLARFAETHALGDDAGVLGQRQVDDAAFISRHGLQGAGPAVDLYLFRHVLGQRAQ